MRFCLLASGSNGNACLVEEGDTRLLIDVGIGPRMLAGRLRPLGIGPADVGHVLVTHEHHDHISGLPGFLKRQPEAVLLATRGTRSALPEGMRRRVRPVRAGQSLALGPLLVLPFSTAHDSAESVGFRIETPTGRLGYVTDLGSWDEETVDALSGLDALIIEANHCPDRLARGPYPLDLKRRIAGPRGHLSNHQCRSLLERVFHPELRHVTAAHLSAVNNTRSATQAALAEVWRELGGDGWSIGRRDQAIDPVTVDGTGVFTLRAQLEFPLG